MKTEFEEDLAKLIEQTYQAGYINACWSDGANVSNEEYHKSEDDLVLATKQFIEKYNKEK